MELNEKLQALNDQVANLTQQRNKVLRELRKNCKHTRLVELDDVPPWRICADCGAEEKGWNCGYQVLLIRGDAWSRRNNIERALIEKTSSRTVFYTYRQSGPLYRVGQSHPSWESPGRKTYKQLTEVLE